MAADHPIEIHIESHPVNSKTYHHVDLRPSSVRFMGGETVTWQSNFGKFAIHFVDKPPFTNGKVVIHSKPPDGDLHITEDLEVASGAHLGSSPYHVAIDYAEDIHMSGPCSACYGC